MHCEYKGEVCGIDKFSIKEAQETLTLSDSSVSNCSSTSKFSAAVAKYKCFTGDNSLPRIISLVNLENFWCSILALSCNCWNTCGSRSKRSSAEMAAWVSIGGSEAEKM